MFIRCLKGAKKFRIRRYSTGLLSWSRFLIQLLSNKRLKSTSMTLQSIARVVIA